MIELQRIRLDKAAVIASLNRRGWANAQEKVDAIAALDVAKRTYQVQLETLSAALNKASKAMGVIIQEDGDTAALASKKQAVNDLKEEAKAVAQQLKACQEALLEKLYQLPNLPHESLPLGKDAQANQVVHQTALLPEPKEHSLPHWELIKKYDLVDFELGNKITGAGFPVYNRYGAKLQRALINFFLDQAVASGYIEVQPPILVNEASAYGTGQLPDKEGQMYQVGQEGFYLIPTAEVSITNIYRGVILAEGELPVKRVGYTPCFRREAGSWGADVRGLNRLHQFDKVELVQICHPAHSYEQLEMMLAYVRGLVEALELPYRVLKLCTGDLGFCAAMTYDIEVWSVAQNKWLEVSSISNFETFQSNRLKLRYRGEDKKIHLLHTLNGSALALPRILAALLELNQSSDGIAIPKVLQPYTGFSTICG